MAQNRSKGRIDIFSRKALPDKMMCLIRRIGSAEPSQPHPVLVLFITISHCVIYVDETLAGRYKKGAQKPATDCHFDGLAMP